jgi:hypothetical protein
MKACVICDVCREPITTIESGPGGRIVVWGKDAAYGDKGDRFLIVHKIECDPKHREATKLEFPFWTPLETFLEEIDESVERNQSVAEKA